MNDSLNTIEEQSLQNEKNSNSNVNSPYIPQVNIPFQLGDEIDDEKFYLYVKECINFLFFYEIIKKLITQNR